MYYILFYKTVPDYIEKRAPFRNEHLRLARESLCRGELLMGGALEDPADSAVLVFIGDSPEKAEQFALNDPYVKNGIVLEWTVRKWNVVVGDTCCNK